MKARMMILAVMMLAGVVRGATEQDFTVTVLHEDEPVREFVEEGKRRAAIPFDSEYKLRLKNSHDRRAVAKVSIDGEAVSKLGDFVLPTNGSLDLERFLDASLDEGKKFKFVSLDHPDVDDPTREENGLVRVEFVLEKESVDVLIIEIYPLFYTNNLIYTIDCATTFTSCSMTEPGATVGGDKSTQQFTEVEIDTEDEVVVVELWITGIIELGVGCATNDLTIASDSVQSSIDYAKRLLFWNYLAASLGVLTEAVDEMWQEIKHEQAK